MSDLRYQLGQMANHWKAMRRLSREMEGTNEIGGSWMHIHTDRAETFGVLNPKFRRHDEKTSYYDAKFEGATFVVTVDVDWQPGVQKSFGFVLDGKLESLLRATLGGSER